MLNEFSRQVLLMGRENLSRLKNSHVAVFGVGGVGGFTEQEAGQLKGALIELSDRIRRAAENIPAPATV